MLPRSFFVVCVLALLAAVVIGSEEKKEEIEDRNPLLAIAVAALRHVFKTAAKNCLEDAAKKCKSDWKNPPELLKCGGRFIKENKGRCAIG